MKHREAVVSLGAIALAVACAQAAHADEIVKIGHAAPLTGQVAHLGKDEENGARLAIEDFNKQGLTIGGKKVSLQLDAQDDAADPRTATQVAQKLVDDHVVAVVGHLNSGCSIPASRIYSDANVLQISPASTNPTYTQQGFKTAYRLVATDAQQGPALAQYAAKTLHVRSVAIVDDSTAYGQGLANEFEKTAKAAGMTVVSHDATSDKATDFRAILTKIKGQRPDAIMYGGEDATGGPFAKQAMQLGLSAKVLAGDGVCTSKLPDLAGDAAKNVICSQPGMPIDKMTDGAAFEKAYETRFHQPIELYAPFAYDAVGVIVAAMKRADSTDPAKILAAMPGIDYNGVIGDVKFDTKGDLKAPVITLYEYKAGQKTTLAIQKM